MTLRSYLKAKRGRAAQLARYLHVSEALISMWANRRRRVPAELCRFIMSYTGVPLASLRRDLFGKK